MNKINYENMTKTSFEILLKNWKLLIPNLLMIIMSLSLLFVFFDISGLASTIAENPDIVFDIYNINTTNDAFDALFTPKFFYSIGIWIFLELVINSFLVVFKYGLISDVVSGKKASINAGLDFAFEKYFKFWGVHAISYVLMYGPLIVLLGIYEFVRQSGYLLIYDFANYLVVFFFMVCFAYIIMMFIRLFYIYPIMSFEKENPFENLKDDFHYVKSHIGHTYVSIIIFLSVLLLWRVMKNYVQIMASIDQSRIFIICVALFALLAEVAMATWEHVFIFKSYYDSKTNSLRKTKSKTVGTLKKSKKVTNKASKKVSTKKSTNKKKGTPKRKGVNSKKK